MASTILVSCLNPWGTRDELWKSKLCFNTFRMIPVMVSTKQLDVWSIGFSGKSWANFHFRASDDPTYLWKGLTRHCSLAGERRNVSPKCFDSYIILWWKALLKTKTFPSIRPWHSIAASWVWYVVVFCSQEYFYAMTLNTVCSHGLPSSQVHHLTHRFFRARNTLSRICVKLVRRKMWSTKGQTNTEEIRISACQEGKNKKKNTLSLAFSNGGKMAHHWSTSYFMSSYAMGSRLKHWPLMIRLYNASPGIFSFINVQMMTFAPTHGVSNVSTARLGRRLWFLW